MNLMHVFVISTAAFLILGSGAAKAKTINDVGAISCVNDKWDVKESEKGHKLVDRLRRKVRVHA